MTTAKPLTSRMRGNAHVRFSSSGVCGDTPVDYNGAHGDVITFVRLADGCSFSEALDALDPLGGATPLETRASDKERPVRGRVTGWDNRERTAPRLVLPHGGTLPERALTADQGRACTSGPADWFGGESVGTPAVDERHLVLGLATAIYHQTLLRSPAALAYLRRRGLSLAVARHCWLGYADGVSLPAYLAADCTLRQAAIDCGLLTRSGREHLAHRLTIPEVRQGRALWMLGRTVPDAGCAVAALRQRAQSAPGGRAANVPAAREVTPVLATGPKYLAMAGTKVLLGAGTAFEQVRRTRDRIGRASGHQRHDRSAHVVPAILVVEGALDYVAACGWRLAVPCVALTGTHASAAQLRDLISVHELAGRPPILLALDADAAGHAATLRLSEELRTCGMDVHTIAMPPGAKDLADLAPRRGGPKEFQRLLQEVLAHLVRGETAAHDTALDEPAWRGGPR